MSLVFAGIMSHGPGMTARADRADPAVREPFFATLGRMREALEASRPDAIMIIAAEHFANFFMNNMPAYCIGMADQYEGPIEDPDWLRIGRRTIPGNPDLSRRIVSGVMERVDVSYAEEWKFDHGIMVPLSFLTPNFDVPVIPANINCQGRRSRPFTAPMSSAARSGKRATRFRSGSRSSGRAESRTGRRLPIPGGSTNLGTANSSIAGCETIARR
jgi:aromatic ring-opening dioxygenase catalytic subunit (LigB family)